MDEVLVPIGTEQIELQAFLKWCGASPTGGEAKALVREGAVKVNGRTETRRSARLQPGDQVDVAGALYRVVRDGS